MLETADQLFDANVPENGSIEHANQQSTAVARVAVDPAVQAAQTARSYVTGFGDLDIVDLLAELQTQTKAASQGETARAESMLAAQAHTLDSIFHALARRAADNIGHYPETVERYLKLALRAQSQSRATWESLSMIRNPPVAKFVGQANITSGPQQVNNQRASAQEKEIEPNELLEQKDGGEWLDRGKESTAINANQELEAVGAIDRSKNCAREGTV